MKKALEGQDAALIKAKTAELQEHMQKIGEELGKAGRAQPEAGGPGPQAQPKAKAADVVEDAEVEILDEENK